MKINKEDFYNHYLDDDVSKEDVIDELYDIVLYVEALHEKEEEL